MPESASLGLVGPTILSHLPTKTEDYLAAKLFILHMDQILIFLDKNCTLFYTHTIKAIDNFEFIIYNSSPFSIPVEPKLFSHK